VRPDVQLGAYTDYPFGITVEPVDDAKVDSVVDQLRDQHASLVPVDGRGAEDGDYAVISFQATRDGAAFEGGSADRFPLIIGKERIIPGFEAQLHGLREGDEKDFTLTFPDDYPDPDLAGKPADFHVTVRELRAKLLPEANDEFAQTIGDYADLAALRADVRRRLEANARDHARHEFADRIIEFAVANASVELPDLLVEREIEVMIDELKLRLAEQRIGWDEYLKVTGRDEAALLAEQREPAQKRVKTLLVLTAIAEREGVDVDDAEIEAEIEKARARYTDNPRLVEYFESPRGRSYLRSTFRRSKIVETLVDRWLAAHPEAGEFPHLEHEPAKAPESAAPASSTQSSERQPETQEHEASPERVA
jgi:trigger factor